MCGYQSRKDRTMLKFIAGFSVGLLPGLILAASIQSHAQLYDFQGNQKEQVVMLSNWSDGQRFSSYNQSPDKARTYFPEGSKVWIWCDGKSSMNQIKKIDTNGNSEWTTINLAEKPVCNSPPLLMSNYTFPRQRWVISKTSDKELIAIQKQLEIEKEFKVTKIISDEKGLFYLVFDPTIPSIYEMGGYRLLDGNLNQISVFEGAPLSPFIDLNNDTVPEFFFPSSDGADAWLYRLFPNLDTENSHYDEFIRQQKKKLSIGDQ